MGIPQILMIFLLGSSLGISLVQHGKDRTGKNNVWVALIAAFIQFGLLWWGGFFN